MSKEPDSLKYARVWLQELLKLAVALHLHEEFLGKWFELCNSTNYVELEHLFSEHYGALEVSALYNKASDDVSVLVEKYSVVLDQYVCMMQSIVAVAHQ